MSGADLSRTIRLTGENLGVVICLLDVMVILLGSGNGLSGHVIDIIETDYVRNSARSPELRGTRQLGD